MNRVNPSIAEIINRDLPDVSLLQNPTYAPGDNAILVATPEELELVLVEATSQLSGFNAALQKERDIRAVVNHETKHAFAAHKVSAVALQFGIHFFAGGKRGINYFAFHRSTRTGNPLYDAAVELYPDVPSWHDTQAAARLGYTVAKVALEAQQHNARRSAITVPIPLSSTLNIDRDIA